MGTWDAVAESVNGGRCWVIAIYSATTALLVAHYRVCVQVIDFVRVRPLLEEWAETVHLHTGAGMDALFTADGKAWRLCRPWPNADKVNVIAALAGTDRTMVQRAFYNGHYGHHGAKALSVLQADSMMHCCLLSVRRHDGALFEASKLRPQLEHLRIGDPDGDRMVRCVTDSAFRKSTCIFPTRTDAQLRAMAPAARATAVAEDSADRNMRKAVETAYNDLVTRWRFADCFRAHRLFQSGRSNFPNLAALWDLLALFSNLFTCTQGGSPVTGIIGVDPPSVEDYLNSANKGFLVFPH